MESIEIATLADVPAMSDLLTILFTQEADFKPDPQKQIRALTLILDSPQSGQLFVARQNDKVVGMISLLFTISTAEGQRVCWLEDMIVHPDVRGSGVGSRLLAHAIDAARHDGLSRITLLTDRANAGAIRFYSKHGFTGSAMTAMRHHL